MALIKLKQLFGESAEYVKKSKSNGSIIILLSFFVGMYHCVSYRGCLMIAAGISGTPNREKRKIHS